MHWVFSRLKLQLTCHLLDLYAGCHSQSSLLCTENILKGSFRALGNSLKCSINSSSKRKQKGSTEHQYTLGGSRWWAQNSVRCCIRGRSGLISRLLVSAWPRPSRYSYLGSKSTSVSLSLFFPSLSVTLNFKWINNPSKITSLFHRTIKTNVILYNFVWFVYYF